jgi:predicted metal-dependent hydrolase
MSASNVAGSAFKSAIVNLHSFMDDAAYRRGLELFNKGEFFDAHEVLEDVWRAAPAGEKKFLQGLIQVAVGLHHHSRGNLAGARSLLARANRNLSTYPARHGGIELGELRVQVEKWAGALEEGNAIPALPRIEADRG